MKPKYCFPADATYVVAEGLGDLGRSFARWMASRGARSLVLLSRSDPISRAARALVSELEMQCVCVVTPQVDIGNVNDLKHTLDNLAKSLAPIRGCIQAAVALRVCLSFRKRRKHAMDASMESIPEDYSPHASKARATGPL